MNVHVVFAHPDPESFTGSVYDVVLRALRKAGHKVTPLDLYRARFQPALSPRERKTYYDTKANRRGIGRFVRPLTEAQALVFAFPVWWFGPPAILKGYFDRVWVPGVAYDVKGDRLVPRLSKLRRIVVFTSYGASASDIKTMGDPVRRMFDSGVRALCSPKARLSWNALYGITDCEQQVRWEFLQTAARKAGRL